MSRKTRNSSEYLPSRRNVLTGSVLALGASALVQPEGGVIGIANAAKPCKECSNSPTTTTIKRDLKKKAKGKGKQTPSSDSLILKDGGSKDPGY